MNENFFLKEFNKEDIKNLLIDKFLPEDFAPSYKKLSLDEFKLEKIKEVELIGKTPDESNIQIAFLFIKHTGINDPRITITREAFKIIKSLYLKNTIAVFYTDNSPNYRISLITFTALKKDDRKVKEVLSNPKRYSYLLGPGTKIHTPTKNLIIKGRIKNEKDLKDSFSLEVVTKDFYQELANWYFWALKYVKFPKDLEKETNGKNIGLIRFITRFMFVWFMKRKGLVPDKLFDKDYLKNILKSLNDNETTYYTAILQNLFFATLNTKIEERRFRKDKEYHGKNQDYMDHRYYRHHDLFKNPDDMLDIFKDIPFLNGGLFACLDKKRKDEDNDTGREIRIDGFSDIKEKQPIFPNFLFFSDEIEVDLTQDYNDTKYRKTKVRGLINILNTYNFTVDENSSVDVDVSLDPELLGRVFENLLASYNPETATTARKATGSYYTPREIVDYMVEESLKEYFKTKLSDIENLEEKLNNLFSYENEENPFNETQTDRIITLINNLKVIDPAVGSGAFPMGMLQKLVFLLSKLDPKNKKWKDEQIKSIQNISDLKLRQQLCNKIEEYFSRNELNYGRKLYLIQNCLYGVDIQPIAIEIAKLRFFLSLLVDEKIDKSLPNHGIEPLPNLEFKLVCANSLIRLPEQGFHQQDFSMSNKSNIDNEAYIKKLRELIDKYFLSYGNEKKKIEKEFKRIQNELYESAKDIKTTTRSMMLAKWKPFDSSSSCEWFEPEWMFGLKDGFDIVIANPPYGIPIHNINLILQNFNHYDRQKNSASFFIELGSKLIVNGGIVIYIVPKSLSFSEGWKKTRDFIVKDNKLLSIIDVSKAFDNVLLEQIIICYSKNQTSYYYFKVGEGWNTEINILNSIENKVIEHLDIIPIYLDSKKINIFNKLQQGSILLANISKTFRGLPLQNNISKNGQIILRGRNIGKYIIYGKFDKVKLSKKNLLNKKFNELLKPKIVSQNIVAHVMKPYDKLIIMAAFDNKGILTLDTVMNTYITVNNFSYEYILAVINSRLSEWFYYWFVYNRAIRTMHFDEYYIGKLPIKNISLKQQVPFIQLINKIISLTHNKNYILNEETHKEIENLENQIDNLVYQLYDLTPEEIKIIEN